MSTMTTQEWLNGHQAVRISGKGIYLLLRLALGGRIRYRCDAGFAVKFHADDMLKIRDDAI